MITTFKNGTEGVTDSYIKHAFSIAFKTGLDEDTTIEISNAGLSPYAQGWTNYQPFVSDDGKHYYRIVGALDGISFTFVMPKGSQYACWFPPYKLQDLRSFCATKKKKLRYHNKMPYISIGDKTKPCIVFIARQHPGESMSSFFLEGMLSSLFGMDIGSCKYSLLIIPLANIGGVEEDNYRLTPDGVDLNRSWDKNHPYITNIKQLLCTVSKIAAVIDLHGDEISQRNYAISSKKNSPIFQKLFPDVLFLPQQSWLRRFAKNLIRHHKLISLFDGKTCQIYFASQNIPAITVEFSAYSTDPKILKDLGMKAASNISILQE